MKPHAASPSLRTRLEVTSLEDRTVPTVVTVAPVSDAYEGGAAGEFTVSRDNTSGNLTVNLSWSGTAAEGFSGDYLAPSSVTLSSGISGATFTTLAFDHSSSPAPTETIISTIASGSYTIGSPSSGTINLLNDGPDVVTVAALNDAVEGGTDGVLEFTRIGNLSSSLTANISVSGTATSGTDYTSIGSTVTFAANSAVADVNVTALSDNLVEGTETVVATVTSGSGYTVGSPSAATVNIADDPPVVSVTETANAIEGGADGVFTFTRTGGDVSSALTAAYIVTGTATSETDYTALSGNLTFAASSSTADVNVVPRGDTVYDPGETVVATISSGTNYDVGSPSAATVTIADSATAPVIADQSFTTVEGLSDGVPVAVVAATPSAGLSLTYSIAAGNTDSTFAIDSTDGTITVANSAGLSYATNPDFSLTVNVTDNGSPAESSTATISISLTEATAADAGEVARIGQLNDKYDELNSAINGVQNEDGVFTTHGLNPADASGPLGKVLVDIGNLASLSASMAGNMLTLNHTAFDTNVGDFQTKMDQLGADLTPLYGAIDSAIAIANSTAELCEGDAFRIAGLQSLLNTLDASIEQVQTALSLEIAATEGIIAVLGTGPYASWLPANLPDNVQNMTNAGTILGYCQLDIESFPEGDTGGSNLTTDINRTALGELNDLANGSDEIVGIEEYLADLDPANGGGAMGLALATITTLSAKTTEMDNHFTTDTDQSGIFNPDKSAYLSGWPSTPVATGLGYLVGSVNPTTTPDTGTFPTGPGYDGTNYSAVDNYGSIGTILGIADNIGVNLTSAEATQATVQTATGVVDKLRNAGMSSYAGQVSTQLQVLSTAVTGLQTKMTTLQSDLITAGKAILLSESGDIIAVYEFVLNGLTVNGTVYKGINDYLS